MAPAYIERLAYLIVFNISYFHGVIINGRGSFNEATFYWEN
jgi:hypothetical protein